MAEPFMRLGLVFGAKLKYLRKAKGWSAQSVAARLGLSVSDLTAIEDGSALASANTLYRAATLFSCQLSDLFHWPPGAPGEPAGPSPGTGNTSDLAQDGLTLLRDFLTISDPAVRGELMRITRFLAGGQP